MEKDNIAKRIEKLKIEDFHPFKQNLIKKYDIDFNKYEGFKDLSEKCTNSIFLNYYADAQFIIIKSYFENQDYTIYSDKEIEHRISQIKLRFWFKLFKYPLSQLDTYERRIIYDDFHTLRRLYERGVFVPSEAMEYILLESAKFNFDSVADKYTTILNIQKKIELNELGLQSYIEKVVPSLLSMDPMIDLNNPDDNKLIFKK